PAAAEAALDRIEDAGIDPDDGGLRIQAREKGCECGDLVYRLGFDDTIRSADVTEEQHGLRVILDEGTLSEVAGSTVDVEQTVRGPGFVIDNPNTDDSCGCGGHH
ncbi:MAG: HesB/IscA family protein, partial [Halanaeroarchaeum sp.]